MTLYDDTYPFYPLQRTPFIFSGRLLAVILVFSSLALGLLLILPGIRGRSRFFWTLRITAGLFVAAVIVALNFTSDWAQATVTTSTSYKSFSSAVVHAQVGLHVGLGGINVTLRGTPVEQLNETIDYNEMFGWHDAMEEKYQEALERGLPTPILYVAEKFTRGSPCRLLGRYRHAGRYASAALWAAFSTWALTNVLLLMAAPPQAGCTALATAVLLLLSAASFAAAGKAPPCVFSIGSRSFQVQLGPSFWLAVVTGVLCVAVGVLVLTLNFLSPERAKQVCGVHQGRSSRALDGAASPVGGTGEGQV